MTDSERQLLEDTARTLLRFTDEVRGRLDCVERALHALYVSDGNGRLALARLQIERDLRARLGHDVKYLEAFVARFEGNRKA